MEAQTVRWAGNHEKEKHTLKDGGGEIQPQKGGRTGGVFLWVDLPVSTNTESSPTDPLRQQPLSSALPRHRRAKGSAGNGQKGSPAVIPQGEIREVEKIRGRR